MRSAVPGWDRCVWLEFPVCDMIEPCVEAPTDEGVSKPLVPRGVSSIDFLDRLWRPGMPRKNKAILRQRRDAAAEWKKGNLKGAMEAYGKANQARKDMQAKKKKNQPKAAAGTEAASQRSATASKP